MPTTSPRSAMAHPTQGKEAGCRDLQGQVSLRKAEGWEKPDRKLGAGSVAEGQLSEQ